MRRRVFINQSLVAISVLASKSVLGKERDIEQPFTIKQFEDKGLAHFSYAILVDRKIVLIDPSRDPQQYYDYALQNNAKITAVIETHPHADFISSHLEISTKEKAVIYTSKLVNATYSHETFDDGDVIRLSKQVSLKAIHTPGHSPDSISVILQSNNKDEAVFTGDALLFGSVGRPDLREYSGESSTEREKLASQMFRTIHQKYAKLNDDVLVYPAHGAGSLCGASIRDVQESTIGYEKTNNFYFKNISEEQFVNLLLKDQPYIPEYFPYDVELNRKGAAVLTKAINAIPIIGLSNHIFDSNDLIIDARSAESYKKSHIEKSINIPDGSKFETWLGTIVKPNQQFFLIASSPSDLSVLINKAAKIGYENFIKTGFVFDDYKGQKQQPLDDFKFALSQNEFLIVDIRTSKEAKEDKIFENAINIPLSELKDKIKAIPTNKPIVVHCASGYRSAIGVSLIKSLAPDIEVFDIGEQIKTYR